MRTESPILVLGPDGRPLAGASVFTRERQSGADATVYAGPTGAAPGSNPAISDAQGRITQWLERGAYSSTITATGMNPWVEEWESSPGEDGSVDNAWLPDDVVDARVLAPGAVAYASLDTALQTRVPDTFVTSLPGSPVDGQIINLLVDTAGTYGGPHVWRLIYRAATAAPYRWHVLDATPLIATVAALPGGETAPGSTYGDFATVGPQITLPFAGDWLFGYGAEVWNTTTAAASNWLALKFGGAATADADGMERGTSATQLAPVRRDDMRRDNLAAATVVKMQGRATANQIVARSRVLSARPLRIG